MASGMSTGVLMGTVTTPSGVPVVAARVFAEPLEGQARIKALGERVGRDGTFRMRLPLGHYLVRVQAPGFLDAFYDAAQNRDDAQAVVLTASGTEVVWPVVMSPVATLSGQVVAAGTRVPVSGGAVIAVHQSERFRKRAPIVDGTFLFEGLVAGAYRVTAEVNGYLIGADSTLVVVQEGDAVADLRIAVAEGKTFQGRVRDAQGQGLAGARVVAQPLQDKARLQYALTDARGVYRISGLEAGAHRVSVQLVGYGKIFYGDTRDADLAQLVAIENEASLDDIDFVLNPIGAIFGTVRNRDNHPLRGARIVAESVIGRKRAQARADANGHYVLPELPEGEYVVWAVADGYMPVFFDGMRSRAESLPVHVQLDAHTKDIDFVLPEGGEISGVVLDAASGRPIAEAVMTARRDEHTESWQTLSGRDGSFVMKGLPDGEYVLFADARHFVPEFWEDAPRAESAKLISVAIGQPQETVQIELSRRLPADFDANGKINFADMLLLVKRLSGKHRARVSFDLNEDGQVDFRDFLFFAQAMQRAGKMASEMGTLRLRQVPEQSEDLIAEVRGERVDLSRGYAVRLRYASEQVAFVGAEPVSNGLFGSQRIWTLDEDGTVLLFVYDETGKPVDGTGVLARLRFRPVDGTTRTTVQTDLGLSLGEGDMLTPIAIPSPLVLEVLPDAFELLQNVPNPFNPETTIAFELPQEADVDLAVYNVVGQRVRSLVRDRRAPGRYHVSWDGRDDLGHDVSSGVYFYRLRANDFWTTRRMLLVR